MAESDAALAEAQLRQALVELRDRIAGDANFASELYRGLTNRRWRRSGGVALSLSWRRAEELINEQRQAGGEQSLTLSQTGDEGQLGRDVEDELARRGWRSQALNTARHHDAHDTSPESPPPPGTGERLAPSEPPEAARRAHEEAEADHRMFPGRPDQSAATAGREAQERE